MKLILSRPSRARGLKQDEQASYAQEQSSRPSRARGLKLLGLRSYTNKIRSRPSRARGLKHLLSSTNKHCTFASITGAWIETEY